MADHRLPNGHVLDRGADLVHPAGVLVAQGERQLGGHGRGEPAVPNVDVGAAHPGPSYPDDHIVRPVDGGLRDVVEAGRFVVGVQPEGLHCGLLRGRSERLAGSLGVQGCVQPAVPVGLVGHPRLDVMPDAERSTDDVA
jgi:hypothetical protein